MPLAARSPSKSNRAMPITTHQTPLRPGPVGAGTAPPELASEIMKPDPEDKENSPIRSSPSRTKVKYEAGPLTEFARLPPDQGPLRQMNSSSGMVASPSPQLVRSDGRAVKQDSTSPKRAQKGMPFNAPTYNAPVPSATPIFPPAGIPVRIGVSPQTRPGAESRPSLHTSSTVPDFLDLSAPSSFRPRPFQPRQTSPTPPQPVRPPAIVVPGSQPLGDESPTAKRHKVDKDSSKKEKKNRIRDEDDILNMAGTEISLSAMPDFNSPGTDWVDTLHERRSGSDIRDESGARRPALATKTPEELMKYMESVENRPGHPRRRRLVQAKKLDRQADGAETPASAPAPSAAQAESAPQAEEAVEGNIDETERHEDPIEAEKQDVVDAARRLRCKRKRRLVAHREIMPDEVEDLPETDNADSSHEQEKNVGENDSTKDDADMEDENIAKNELRDEVKGKHVAMSDIPAEDIVVKRNSEANESPGQSELSSLQAVVKAEVDDEEIILAEDHEGRVRRWRVTRKMASFWTVRGMTTSLLNHQILGVDWMVTQKELGEDAPHGGILADVMGLGKTMQVIATMVLNPPPIEGPPSTSKVTLVVAPVALLAQWKEEIENHTSEGVLRVHIHHGSQRLQSLKQLAAYDVIITSYATIAFSHPAPKRPRGMSDAEAEVWWEELWEKRGMFHRTRFWRVCLDESHYIKNSRSRTSCRCQIVSTRVWSY